MNNALKHMCNEAVVAYLESLSRYLSQFTWPLPLMHSKTHLWFLVAFVRSFFLSPFFFISLMLLCTTSFDVNEKMWKITKFFTLNLITALSEISPGLLGLFVGLLSIACGFIINLYRIPHELACLALGVFEHVWLH